LWINSGNPPDFFYKRHEDKMSSVGIAGKRLMDTTGLLNNPFFFSFLCPSEKIFRILPKIIKRL